MQPFMERSGAPVASAPPLEMGVGSPGSDLISPLGAAARTEQPPNPALERPRLPYPELPYPGQPGGSGSSQRGDSSPPVVTEVRIVGNRRIAPEKILAQIRTRAGRPFDPRLIEEDVRRLNQTRWFASVRVYWQPVPEGRMVIFEVVEHPLIQYVKIVGNEWYPKKRLLEEAGIRPGDGMDPFLIEEARRKIEDFYRQRGFAKARVSLVEGSDPNDPGVIFLISEGPRQRVLWTDFVGNSISSDAKLRTKVQTKPGWFWLIRGYWNPDDLERDRLRVLEYYRSLGFFRAEVGSPIVEFNDDRTWARVRFVVNEGPRYRIREVRIFGNRVLETQDLFSALELKPGKYFSQAEMEADVKTLQEKYGSIGYVFADIRSEPRFLEEPGLLDLVYTIDEGVRCRVGRIDVAIKDQYNAITHTQWSTVLNRISLAPGDIVDIRELRASERRLRASGLFEVDPSKGISPKIVVVPPDPEEVEALLARQRSNQVRGQTPEVAGGSRPFPTLLRALLPRTWIGEILPPWAPPYRRHSGEHPDYFVVLRLEGEVAKQPRQPSNLPEDSAWELSPSEENPEHPPNLQYPDDVFQSQRHSFDRDSFEKGTPAQTVPGASLEQGPGGNSGRSLPSEGTTTPGKFVSCWALPPEAELPLVSHTASASAIGAPGATVLCSREDITSGRLTQALPFGGELEGQFLTADRGGIPGIHRQENVVRGQYTPEGGISLSPLRPWRVPSGSANLPSAESSNTAYGSTQGPIPPPSAHTQHSSLASGIPQPGPAPLASSGNPEPWRTESPAVHGLPGGHPRQSVTGSETAPLVPVREANNLPGMSAPGSTIPASGGVAGGNLPIGQPAAATRENASGVPPTTNPLLVPGDAPPPGSSDPSNSRGSTGVVAGPTGPGVVPVPTPPPNVAPDVLPPLLGQPPDTEPTIPVPLQPEVYEGRTGRIMLSAGINSDAGLIGSLIVDEQNFDWRRWPRSWEDIRSGVAWRGAGQRFRLELVPGTEVQRYMASFQEPYLFDTDVSFGLSGYYYNRKYAEWDEDRVGGRVAFGYQFTHDLSGTFAVRAAEIRIYDPGAAYGLVPELDEVLGSNTLVGFGVTLTHDTRDSAFLPTEGHLYELSFEQVVGSFDYPRAELELRRYFLLRQHPDGSGRHVMSVSTRLAYTGSNTPIYEHYFAGGYSTLRGFAFRGASPRDLATGLRIGGHFMLLASAEYMFPLTADDMLRLVIFCDTGTVQPDIDDWTQNYRVALGFGFRITLPALGPAPIALDFAFPVSKEPGDKEQVFSFFLGFFR